MSLSRIAVVSACVSAGLTLPAPAASLARDSSGPPGAPFVPGELLVRFERSADPAERAAALHTVDAKTRERLFVPRLRLVEIDRDASVRDAAAEFERRPGVLYAEPNFIDRPESVPNDPLFASQWALDNTGQLVVGDFQGTPDADIDAPEAWDQSVGSASVIVGIADTGVAYTHPDLAPNIYRNRGESGGGRETNGVDDDGNGYVDDFRGYDFFDGDNNPAPSGASRSTHGTQVAGEVGARGNNSLLISGVSQQVALMPLRIGDTSAAISKEIEAFGYASALGADVINLSAVGPTFSQARLDAIRAAPTTLFVFAAGNNASNVDVTPFYPCDHNEPNVVCVAATSLDDGLASFSNYGPHHVDLAAPGVLILTTTLGGGYTFASGTSDAAPIVAGAAALYKAEHPSATAAQTRNALRARVDKLASLNGRVETGGRLNLNRVSPPDTAITKGPKRKVKTRKKKKKRVKFKFASSEVGSTFQCQVDSADFAPCSTPFRHKFKRGKHTFLVRATDVAGNTDPTPAAKTFKVKEKK